MPRLQYAAVKTIVGRIDSLVCTCMHWSETSEHKNAQEYTRDYKSAVSRMEMNGAKMSPGEQFLSSGVQSAREKFWRRVD